LVVSFSPFDLSRKEKGIVSVSIPFNFPLIENVEVSLLKTTPFCKEIIFETLLFAYIRFFEVSNARSLIVKLLPNSKDCPSNL